MTKLSLFDFKDYKQYLLWREQNWQGRAMRRELAAGTGCQPAYVSQVLNGNNHFSLEQAEKANTVLGHVPLESHFFMLTVQMNRAGTVQLKTYFENQILKIKEGRAILKNRVDVKEGLNKEQQQTYYNNHLYALIHVALTVEKFQTVQALSERFQIPKDKVREILEFLVNCGLAVRKKDRYEVGTARIHLGSDSKFISRHHVNWRIKSLENIDLRIPEDLHYSSVISCSEDDIPLIKERLIAAIEEIKKIIKDSPAKDIFVFNADMFQLKR